MITLKQKNIAFAVIDVAGSAAVFFTGGIHGFVEHSVARLAGLVVGAQSCASVDGAVPAGSPVLCTAHASSTT